MRSPLAKSDRWTTMALTLLIWFCTLPLVALVVWPVFGWQAAGLAALGLFSFLLPICWAICWFRVSH